MFKGYIYKCTCVISGKSYVGLTTKTIEENLPLEASLKW